MKWSSRPFFGSHHVVVVAGWTTGRSLGTLHFLNHWPQLGHWPLVVVGIQPEGSVDAHSCTCIYNILSRPWAHLSRSWGGHIIYRCCFILSLSRAILHTHTYIYILYRVISPCFLVVGVFASRCVSHHNSTRRLSKCVCVWVCVWVCVCKCFCAWKSVCAWRGVKVSV